MPMVSMVFMPYNNKLKQRSGIKAIRMNTRPIELIYRRKTRM